MKLAVNNHTNIEFDPRGRSDTLIAGLLWISALVAIASLGYLFALWWQTSVPDEFEVLRIASREFVSGNVIVAGELAETVVLDDSTKGQALAIDSSDLGAEPRDRRGSREIEAAQELAAKRRRWSALRDFLVGAGRAARARAEPDMRLRRRMLHEAIPYLQSSERLGFPDGRTAYGYRVLGESLCAVGRYDKAIESLHQAIEEDSSARRELLPLLARSQLNAMAPLTEQSLKTIESLLADPTLMPQQRRSAELIRLRAMIALGMWQRVDETIQQTLQASRRAGSEPSNELRHHQDELRLLQSIAEITRAINRYGPYGGSLVDGAVNRESIAAQLRPAVDRMNRIQREPSHALAAEARLWTARAFRLQGLLERALTQLASVRQQRPFAAESIVSGLEEIELFARLGRGVEVLQTTRYLMREMGDAGGFDGRLMTFVEFQRRLLGAIELLRQQGDFETAIDIARSLPPVFDLVEALTQEGISFRAWAAATIAGGTNASGDVNRNAASAARARYRAAGDAFAQAAALQFDTDEYVDTQWSAIEAYQQGRHFARSLHLLKPYLRYEASGRLPRGLVAYGRALLAEDDPDAAIEALTTCIIEYPRDPLRYDARLLSALAYAEKGDFDSANRLLQDNLQDGELTPQSPAWRDSLLTLGELLYERGYRNHLVAEQSTREQRMRLLRENQPILEEAIRRLDEAVERYWPIPRAEAAAYLSARASVMASLWPKLRSQSDEILEAARRTLRRQADQRLQVALNGFARLHRHLIEREEEQRLRETEQSILRNSLLAEEDVIRDLQRLEDAASAYRTVELRYMNEPPALEAMLGRASCVRELGHDDQAKRLIRQASVILQRIPSEMDGQFVETTRYDRSGWEQLLGWMNQRASAGGV